MASSAPTDFQTALASIDKERFEALFSEVASRAESLMYSKFLHSEQAKNGNARHPVFEQASVIMWGEKTYLESSIEPLQNPRLDGVNQGAKTVVRKKEPLFVDQSFTRFDTQHSKDIPQVVAEILYASANQIGNSIHTKCMRCNSRKIQSHCYENNATMTTVFRLGVSCTKNDYMPCPHEPLINPFVDVRDPTNPYRARDSFGFLDDLNDLPKPRVIQQEVMITKEEIIGEVNALDEDFGIF